MSAQLNMLASIRRRQQKRQKYYRRYARRFFYATLDGRFFFWVSSSAPERHADLACHMVIDFCSASIDAALCASRCRFLRTHGR